MMIWLIIQLLMWGIYTSDSGLFYAPHKSGMKCSLWNDQGGGFSDSERLGIMIMSEAVFLTIR